MVDADSLLKGGDLDGARAALVAKAKQSPGDVPTRMFLFQLLALAGEWDKARSQLETIARLSPAAQMLSVAYGQAIDAERQRARALSGQERVPVLARGGDWIDGLVDALAHLGRGEMREAKACRDAAFDVAPDTPGLLETSTGETIAFDWLADAEPWFGPALEAIVAGRWGLLPFDAITSVTSEGPQDLRDTIWLPAQVMLTSGQSVAALLPVRYPGSEASDDVGIRTSGATDWTEEGRGRGQRLLLASDGSETGLLGLHRLKFGPLA